MINRITQIFISDGGSLGPELEKRSATFRRHFSGCEHVVFNYDMVREFISSHYHPNILRALEKVKPYSYKCDLARFCIVNILGGWYFDIGLTCNTSISFGDDVSLVAFRDIQRDTWTSWACWTALFCAKPRHEALEKAIEIASNNILNEYYGESSLCPTGPVVWGRAVASLGMRKGFVFGDHMHLTPGMHENNSAAVLPDGTILAFGKKSAAGNLSSLGAAGTNNYVQMWAERDVYNPG